MKHGQLLVVSNSLVSHLHVYIWKIVSLGMLCQTQWKTQIPINGMNALNDHELSESKLYQSHCSWDYKVYLFIIAKGRSRKEAIRARMSFCFCFFWMKLWTQGWVPNKINSIIWYYHEIERTQKVGKKNFLHISMSLMNRT